MTTSRCITTVYTYSYTPATPPPPDGSPTDLNTSESDVPDTVSSDHSISDRLHHLRWVSDPLGYDCPLDPRAHPYDLSAVVYSLHYLLTLAITLRA